MSFVDEYKAIVIEINKNWDLKAERYILLGLGFFCSWFVYVPLILIHTKIAGLKKEDRDLFTLISDLDNENV